MNHFDSRRTCGADPPDNHRECDRHREYLRHLDMKRCRRGRARRPRAQTQAALSAFVLPNDARAAPRTGFNWGSLTFDRRRSAACVLTRIASHIATCATGVCSRNPRPMPLRHARLPPPSTYRSAPEQWCVPAGM
ncbi:hypothetical protein EVAR_17766_1 [Eumeta japonica]|uniref:Uncharacterized protein n=1 Tax=Eumeta variegata TaxID=151549 RepID=A0A4C1TTZ8_EUMVA|nr:hypothetical protein EVAR_17766_1 [Eumeta japonica]